MSSYSGPAGLRDTVQAIFDLPAPQDAQTGLPVPNSTHSFWINSPGANPLAKEGSEGPLTDDADICIIGSGITGVSAAYHLAKQFGSERDKRSPPVKAIILEARDFCSGATGRNGGHLTAVRFGDFVIRENSYGTDEAKKAYELERHNCDKVVELIEAQGWVDAVDLVSSYHIDIFMTKEEELEAKADFSASVAAGTKLDDVEWLSGEKMWESYGTSYPGFRNPANNLWPLKFVTKLFGLARDLSPDTFQLDIHTNTPVTSVIPIQSSSPSDFFPRRWALSTARGSVKCSYVIHATNAYTSYLLPHFHGPDGIVPTRGQVMALRAVAPADVITKASWGGNQGFEYWFPRPVKGDEVNPLVILGGGRNASGPNFETYVTDDSTVNKEVGEELRRFLPGVFPGKYEKGREPEMEWTGIMGYTKVQDPFVGPVVTVDKQESEKLKGQYVSAGYTGHGMARAFACAEAVVGMVIADIEAVEWKQPEWLPRYFLTTERLVQVPN